MISSASKIEATLIKTMARLNELYRSGIETLRETEQAERLNSVDRKLHTIMEQIQTLQQQTDFADHQVKALLTTSPRLCEFTAAQRELVECFLELVQRVERRLLANREGLAVRRDRQHDFHKMQAAYRQTEGTAHH